MVTALEGPRPKAPVSRSSAGITSKPGFVREGGEMFRGNGRPEDALDWEGRSGAHA